MCFVLLCVIWILLKNSVTYFLFRNSDDEKWLVCLVKCFWGSVVFVMDKRNRTGVIADCSYICSYPYRPTIFMFLSFALSICVWNQHCVSRNQYVLLVSWLFPTSLLYKKNTSFDNFRYLVLCLSSKTVCKYVLFLWLFDMFFSVVVALFHMSHNLLFHVICVFGHWKHTGSSHGLESSTTSWQLYRCLAHCICFPKQYGWWRFFTTSWSIVLWSRAWFSEHCLQRSAGKTKVFCITRTIRTRTYSVFNGFCIHDVEDLHIKDTTIWKALSLNMKYENKICMYKY